MKHEARIKSFGQHLKKIRAEKGMSQQELADRANIAKQTIYRIENAQFAVTLDVLLALSEGLEMPLKDLMDFPILPTT
ncbi:helix-turn-helix domain-containing protein [Adhaeribacter radiodurans]|uniref:Helix-turn-helix transcriptional regulator n=1 Tax=Adhaeribacter radiodurans TaxID=2745197 RepID=A0A7L7LCC9_9BACT|nr:helix-turn-helix transcriptional regulator [Adhaeribacter radiodurans]QMU30502.1 helix-turn-helix transcriptional regulator [Adhaeribacter radiodurans]